MAFSLYILDLDGTLYRGNEPVPGAAEAMAELRRRGKAVRFVTNNSRATRSWVVEKLARMDIVASPEEVLSSGIAAARLLARRGWHRAFLVGEPGLFESVRDEGVRAVNASPNLEALSISDERADAVLVGICRSFTYDLLNGALQQVLAGARFVATNTDATYPVEGGRVVPGAGAIVASLQTCSGIAPIVVGKPEPLMLEMILEETGCDKSQVLVVGDRIETDIEWGRRAGCPTHLVLTGVTHEAPPSQRWSPDLRGILEA
jgi:4-nitrophenyl phosphatase